MSSIGIKSYMFYYIKFVINLSIYKLLEYIAYIILELYFTIVILYLIRNINFYTMVILTTYAISTMVKYYVNIILIQDYINGIRICYNITITLFLY